MTTTIKDDFTDRVRCADYLRGMVTVSFALYIPLGPRANVAGVRLSYDGQYSLQFESKVTWTDDDYEAAVRRGILLALDERGRHSIGGKFILIDATVDPIHSCESAFCLASREAAASILRLLKSHDEANTALGH
jgi:hypothetical protein